MANSKWYYTDIKLNILYRFMSLLFVIHNFCDNRLVYQIFVRQLLLSYFWFFSEL